KLSADGTTLLFSTYLGGTKTDFGTGIAVDTDGNAYLIGNTQSTDFPTTANAYQKTLKGNSDPFIAKVSATGSDLLYATYLGGSANTVESGYAVAVDAGGYAFVTGLTSSTDFPTTNGVLQKNKLGFSDAFVAKINPSAPNGPASLVYSTYLGGTTDETGYSIAVDVGGDAFVAGYTNSFNFPTKPNGFQTTYGGLGDGFLAELNPSASALLYSTYVGGSQGEQATGVAVDGDGNAYVTGYTESTNFKTRNAYQDANQGGSDAFVVKINPSLSGDPSLVYATYLGGSNDDNNSFSTPYGSIAV